VTEAAAARKGRGAANRDRRTNCTARGREPQERWEHTGAGLAEM